MKPPRFEYEAPQSTEQALALLASGGPDAKLLAGGQSLMPALNLRLARPSLLIDLGRVGPLRGIKQLDDGSIVAGGMTRHRDFETSALVREHLPLVHAAMPGIAHMAIRSRGTIGGSLAHADPAADWPALCLACDARFTLRSQREHRSVAAHDFFQGFFTTALADGEILTEVRFPAWPPGRRWAIEKFARRRGDFAIVGVIVIADAAQWSIVVHGAGDKPAKVTLARDRAKTHERVAKQVSEQVPCRSDLHASAEYRRELVELLTSRAIARADRS